MTLTNGLCGSNVQKSWLESTLKNALQTSAHFGPNFSNTQFGMGEGFYSIMIRVVCDWQGEDTQKLPASVVLKIPSLIALEQGNGAAFEEHREGTYQFLRKAHLCEISFYNLIQDHQLQLPVPKMYYSCILDADGQIGLIIMEDLTQSAAIKPFADGIPLKGLETIMENLAALHAFSLTNTQWLDNSHLKAYLFSGQSLMAQGWITGSIDTFKKLAPELFPDSFLDRLIDMIGPQFDKEYAFHVHEELGIPPVLTHGDLYNNNLMWKKTADGNGTTDELLAFVDWQVTHPGCVGEDFARLFCGSVEADIRREHTDHLLEYYYKTLTALLNKEPPFTIDQLKEAYRRLFKFGTIAFLPALGHFAQLLLSDGKVAEKDAVMRRTKLLIEDLYVIEG